MIRRFDCPKSSTLYLGPTEGLIEGYILQDSGTWPCKGGLRRVQVNGFRVQVNVFRVQGLGFRYRKPRINGPHKQTQGTRAGFEFCRVLVLRFGGQDVGLLGL